MARRPESRQHGRPEPRAGPHPEKRALTAYDLKPLHAQFCNLSDEELKCIRVLAPGTRLEQGATYIDLRDPGRGEFTGSVASFYLRDFPLCFPVNDAAEERWHD